MGTHRPDRQHDDEHGRHRRDTTMDEHEARVHEAGRAPVVRMESPVLEHAEDPHAVEDEDPVAWERIHELWYNHVKGRNAHESFGIYDTVRHDTVWLDKV